MSLRQAETEPVSTQIAVVTAGTSDQAVAEEAALTAEFYGNPVLRISDVGVAGVHRLLARLDEIRSARVVIVVAGMEGALPSVVGGLIDKPVIAAADERRLRGEFQRCGGPARDAQQLCVGRVRGEHRQRLRGWIPRQYDQPSLSAPEGRA